MHQNQKISIKPCSEELEYKGYFNEVEGCIHRVPKMSLNPLQSNENNVVIESNDKFETLIYFAIKPVDDNSIDAEKKEKIVNFFKSPIYIACSLSRFEEYFSRRHCMQNVSFLNLIKKHTISYPDSRARQYIYNPSNSLPGLPEWPGDIILLIYAKDTKQNQIKAYQVNINFLIDTMCCEPDDENGKYYYRKNDTENFFLDREDKKTIAKKVIFVKDIRNYFLYLKNNVNSFNLQAAVNCFNDFTETGQMKWLPFYTLPKYQLTTVIVLIVLIVGYAHKK
jgi:hypothetical protein